MGGGVSELVGGSFGDGFVFAASLSSLDHAFKAVARVGGAKFGPSGDNLFGSQVESESCRQGTSFCSKFLRLFPGLDATSKFHDEVRDYFKKFVPSMAANWPTMVPSFAILIGAVAQKGYVPPYTVLRSTIQKDKEEEDDN